MCIRDSTWIEVDAFDSNRAFLGTEDGIMTTTNLRKSTSQDWFIANSLRTATLKNTIVTGCRRHQGHWYSQTRAALPDINYPSNGPENLVIETWDYGKTFKDLTGNRSQGDIQFISPDLNDPDSLWITFSRALSLLRRKKEKNTRKGEVYDTPFYPGDPTVGEMLLAGLSNIELKLDQQQHNLDLLKYRNFIPSKVTLSFEYATFNLNNVFEQIQYASAGPRFLGDISIKEWRLMGFANWSLPDIVLNGIFATPMLRYRVLMMDEEVRQTITNRIHRNYGEYQRLKSRLEQGKDDDLLTRTTNTVRLDYLEAVLDLTTAGYLSRWLGKKER